MKYPITTADEALNRIKKLREFQKLRMRRYRAKLKHNHNSNKNKKAIVIKIYV